MNPYLAHACVRALCADGQIDKTPEEAIRDYNKALTAGVLKIASKMGVSVLQAYQSAQLFEAVGLDQGLVKTYFTNTPCSLGGTDLNRIEADSRYHHEAAFAAAGAEGLVSEGKHKYRRGEAAEEHLYAPETIHLLQQAVYSGL